MHALSYVNALLALFLFFYRTRMDENRQHGLLQPCVWVRGPCQRLLCLWNIKTAYVPPLRALARYFPSSTAAASACTNPVDVSHVIQSRSHVDVCCDDKSIDIAQIIQTRLKSNPCIQLPEESTWWTSDKVPEGPSFSEVFEQAEKLYFESVKAIRDNVMLMIDSGVESRAEDIRPNLDEGMWLGIRGSLVTGYSFRESNPWMLGREIRTSTFLWWSPTIPN